MEELIVRTTRWARDPEAQRSLGTYAGIVGDLMGISEDHFEEGLDLLRLGHDDRITAQRCYYRTSAMPHDAPPIARGLQSPGVTAGAGWAGPELREREREEQTMTTQDTQQTHHIALSGAYTRQERLFMTHGWQGREWTVRLEELSAANNRVACSILATIARWRIA